MLAQITRSSLSSKNNGYHAIYLRSICPSYPARRNVGQSLIQNCTAISLWSWLAARSSLSELHADTLHCCPVTARFRKQHSASASPCKCWPGSGHGFATSLLHAGQMPVDFLMLSVPKHRKRCFFQCLRFFIHLLTLSSVMLPCNSPALPSFSPPFCPYCQDNLFFQLKSSFFHWN